MNRNELTDITREAALAVGYSFYTGQTHRTNSEVRAYPAVWLEPLVMKARVGRNEGHITYRATLHFMALPTSQGNETVWEQLEADAIALCRAIEQDERVSAVSVVSCTPSKGTLTANGEVSIGIVCDVKMWYYL
jgi:hypothetical protein